MSLKKNENIHQPTCWKKWLNKVRAHVYRSPLYLVTLKKKKQLEIPPFPAVLMQPDLKNARNLLAGKFPFAGRLYQSDDQPWTTAQDDEAWQSWVHGFGWLHDLCAHEDPQAIVLARQWIRGWIDLHGVWTQTAWRADVMADRLIHWMACAHKLTQTADEDFLLAFNTSLSLQASHLMRSYFRDLSGYALLRALKGQLYVGLLLKGYHKSLNRVEMRFSSELERQILPDGGHVSRSPQVMVLLLAMVLELMESYRVLQRECPDALRLSVDRLAPMIRSLRHGDGGLALFHGSQEGEAAFIEHLLDQTGNHGKALGDARHTAYQRVEAAQTVMIMDVGVPPFMDIHRAGHAAPLSFELSCEDERILVNCGSVLGGDPSWQEALGATAAHNSVTVDDKNCLTLFHGGGVQAREISVSSKRYEENGEVLIEAEHDAYKEQMGLICTRSVYVSKTGNDIRVEDRLTGSGGSHYAISLHLHPDVHASLVQDGQAALLKTQHGTGWHLRIQGGKLEMKESIYVGNPGQMRHTDQIIIQGPLRGEGMCVKWRLSRLGSA